MRPIWHPISPEKSTMYAFLQYVEQHYAQHYEGTNRAKKDYTSLYRSLHRWSVAHPEQCWEAVYHFFRLDFPVPAHSIYTPDPDMLAVKWFTGAAFNFADIVLRRRDQHPALISIDEQQHRRVISFAMLHTQTMACAAAFLARGITPGDRIAGFMPNIAETIIAALAASAVGAIWASCSTDFGAEAAIDRLGQITPKILVTVPGYTYQGRYHSVADKVAAITQAIPSLTACIVVPFQNAADTIACLQEKISWESVMETAPITTCQTFPFDHPLYILFSSGTTGKPKCIIHGQGGTLLQHIKELGLHGNLGHHDNLLFYTTCGWMMWNWMVSALALGCTLTLYEGAPHYPNYYRLFDIMAQERVTALGTSAKFIAMLEKSEVHPKNDYPLPDLNIIFSTGSPLLPEHYDYVYQHIHPAVQLASISGGTDIISCFALGNPMLPVYRGELQSIGLGMAVNIYDPAGHPLIGSRGELVCEQAFPSMPIGFWNDADQSRYRKAYFERFPSVWTHGDFAQITTHGGLIIYGRSDTILNPGGVRIGTAEIYREVEKIPEILESVVIGQAYDGDVRIVLFVKLQPDTVLDESLQHKIRHNLRHNASPRHVPAIILAVSDIPKTMNGKITELAIKQIVAREPIDNLHAIANPEALESFKNRTELL